MGRKDNCKRINDKEKVIQGLDRAIELTHKMFFPFLGVIIFGSFTTDKLAPNDLDLMPVLSAYGSNWDFSPAFECDVIDSSPDYRKYREMETFFIESFENITGLRGVVHIENLVALNSPVRVAYWAGNRHTSCKNFRGIDYARRKLVSIL